MFLSQNTNRTSFRSDGGIMEDNKIEELISYLEVITKQLATLNVKISEIEKKLFKNVPSNKTTRL